MLCTVEGEEVKGLYWQNTFHQPTTKPCMFARQKFEIAYSAPVIWITLLNSPIKNRQSNSCNIPNIGSTFIHCEVFYTWRCFSLVATELAARQSELVSIDIIAAQGASPRLLHVQVEISSSSKWLSNPLFCCGRNGCNKIYYRLQWCA